MSTIKLKISDELRSVLENISSRNVTAKQLLAENEAHMLCEDHCDYIGISSDGKSLSYLTSDRISMLAETEDPYTSKKRYEPKKPGSTLMKIINKISTKEVELFVNAFKSEIERKSKKLKMVTIKGESFIKGYSNSIYKKNEDGIVAGELGGNCMAHENRQGLLKMYLKADNVELLLLVEDNDELFPTAYGRALLWTTTTGERVIDRVYTIKREEYFDYFLDYGMRNDFYVRETGTHNSSRTFYKNGEVVVKYFEVEIPKGIEQYPYMDTFKFFTKDGLRLTNNDEVNDKILITNDGSYKTERFNYELFSNALVSTGKDGGNQYAKLTYMDNAYVLRTELIKSSLLDVLIHKNHCVFNEKLNDYIFIDDSLNDHKLIDDKMNYIKTVDSKADEIREKLRKMNIEC